MENMLENVAYIVAYQSKDSETLCHVECQMAFEVCELLTALRTLGHTNVKVFELIDRYDLD